jgi:hypothetical protein
MKPSRIAWALVLTASTASAAPQARLVYGRGAGASACADEDALRRAVAARVKYDPFFPWAPRTVVVSITERDARLVARVELFDDRGQTEGTRELASSSSDCATLFDTLALTISIAIDPRVLTGPVTAPPAPAPMQEAPAGVDHPAPRDDARVAADHDPEEAPPADPASASAPRDWPDFRLSAGARGVLGTQPSPTGGLAIGGALVFRRASIGVELGADWPTSADAPGGGRARAWVGSASLLPCAHLSLLRGCAVATAGRLEASGVGVAAAETRAAVYLALGARLAFEVPVAPRLALFAHADLMASMSRPTLRVGADDVWRAPPLSSALGIGVAAFF